MAHYELNMSFTCDSSSLYVTEHAMYGSSRLGVDSRRTLLYLNGHDGSLDTTTYTHRDLGMKQFELSNHLGNVLVTVTDKPIARTLGSSVAYFEPEISNITDFYSLGSAIPL